MPPKKKKAEEQKKKIVDDKTFGLKNKKKSKKVQQYVETVKKQANQKVDGPRKRAAGASGASSAASSARMAQMAARLAELELMNQPVKEKPKKISPEEAERRRREEEAEKERIRIANLPIEDQIEEERAKLTTRTPVSLPLFLEWKKEKEKERSMKLDAVKAAAYKKMSKAERARGQGLTGRELFQASSEIFVDDEEADDSELKPENEYIGSDNEDEKEGDQEQVKQDTIDDVTSGDASLFETNLGDAGPSTQTEAVGVGDESLFT